MLSVAQSAEILGVSKARVCQLISEGTLPAQKVGRAWALSEKDVYNRLSSRVSAGRPSKVQDATRSDALSQNATADGAQDNVLCPRETLDLNDLYQQCKKMFSRRPTAQELRAIESQEEAAFRVALSDFFLQQKQRELIDAGVY